MQNLKLYSVSDRYIAFLRKNFPNVYSNKINTRIHTRKYVGVVLLMAEYSYFIPLSSPKNSDYQNNDRSCPIRKSIVPIMRIVVKNTAGVMELKGTLRISHMIPVPETELKLYDVDGEQDSTYKDLVQNEFLFLRKNNRRILDSAKLLYKQKAENDTTAKYISTALDFKALEQECERFMKMVYDKEHSA